MPCTWLWPSRWTRSVERRDEKNRVQSKETGLKLLHQGPAAAVEYEKSYHQCRYIADHADSIIAIHGLNGHREKSWTAPNNVNWLRNLLPADIPNSRIYTWGYDMSTQGPGSKSPQEVSELLVSEIWDMRESTGTTDRPIIFIAHSLGGNIVKSALLYSNSAPTSLLHLRNISISTYGVVFLDTPELDASFSGLQMVLENTEPSNQDENYNEARWLLDTLQQYVSISDRYQTVLVKARRAQDTPAGTSTSVDSNTQQQPHPLIVVNADHNSVNKFESSLDDGYSRIRDRLVEITQHALSKEKQGQSVRN